MRVSVDSDRCIGSGQCAWAIPEVFDQDEEEGTVILLQPHPPEQLHGAVAEAAIVCPASAITVDEE